MAYAFGSDSVGFGGGTGSATTITTGQTITVAVGDTIFAWFMVDTGGHTFTVADNFLNNYVIVGSTIAASGPGTAALYICRGSNSAGTCSITVTIDTAATNRSMSIGTISGLSTSATLSQNTANVVMTAGTDGLTTVTAAPSAQPAIVLGFQWNYFNNTMSVGTGFTVAPGGALANGLYFGGQLNCIEHKRVTSTAATAATLTVGAGNANGAALVELIIPETGAGGGGGTGTAKRLSINLGPSLGVN